jgi:L-seryl-tRNA(Ser) seleniumtransferase
VAAAVEPRFRVEVVELQGQIGSGSLPVERLPSAGLALVPALAKGAGRALEALAASLREGPVPVIGRIADGRLLLDLRCLDSLEALRPALQALRPVAAADGGAAVAHQPGAGA